MSPRIEPPAPPLESVKLHPVGGHAGRRGNPDIPAQLLPAGFLFLSQMADVHRLDFTCRDEAGKEVILHFEFDDDSRIWSIYAHRPGAEDERVTLPTRSDHRRWRIALEESE